MLGLMDDVPLLFGFSGRTIWIWPLALISDRSDGATPLLSSSYMVAAEDFSRRNLSVEWFLFDLVQGQHQAAYFSFRTKQPGPISRSAFWKFRFGAIQFINFQRSFDWGFQQAMRCQFVCFVIPWDHGWGCCWGWWKFCPNMAFRDTLLETVGSADLEMDLMPDWWCYFLLRLFLRAGYVKNLIKRPETIVCGNIGLAVLSGLGSCRTHPVGVEGATMARRAPFPLSSMPAYIDRSMKLFVCLSVRSRCSITMIVGGNLYEIRSNHIGKRGVFQESLFMADLMCGDSGPGHWGAFKFPGRWKIVLN